MLVLVVVGLVVWVIFEGGYLYWLMEYLVVWFAAAGLLVWVVKELVKEEEEEGSDEGELGEGK